MRIGDAYPSNYLGSDDFDRPALATVARCEMQNIGQGADTKQKPVVYFHEYTKPLILNKTNFSTLASVLGDDSDGWGGGHIVLFSSRTEFQGEEVNCVRLRAPKPVAEDEPMAETEPVVEAEPSTF